MHIRKKANIYTTTSKKHKAFNNLLYTHIGDLLTCESYCYWHIIPCIAIHVYACLLTAVYLDETHLILIMSMLPPASLYDPSSVILPDISQLPVSSLHLSSTLSSLWVSVPVSTRGGTVSRRGGTFPRWWRSVSYRTTSTTEWRRSPVSWGRSVTWRNNNTRSPAATLTSQEKAQGIGIKQPTLTTSIIYLSTLLHLVNNHTTVFSLY